jgi:hypothetical protein
MLFLVGAMRSGTTYFRNILSANQNIQAIGSELNKFWTNTGKAPCGLIEECPHRAASDANDAIRNNVTQFFDQTFRQKNMPRNVLYRAYRKMKYGNETLIKNGHPYYLLNKSTHLLNKIEYINALFPKALFIYICREPYAQAYSLYRHISHLQNQGWKAEYPDKSTNSCWSFTRKDGHDNRMPAFSSIPRYWVEQNALALRDLDICASGRVLHVRYEELISNPNTTLDRLQSYLGMSHINTRFSRQMINSFSSNPLSDWSKHLEKEQISCVEKILETYSNEVEFIDSHF